MEEIVKKIISLFLILLAIIGVATTPLSGYPTAKAENETAGTKETAEKKVSTDIFLPTSYLQYYKLEKPYAVCRFTADNRDFVAVSHKKEIVIYGNEKFKKITLNIGEDQRITAIDYYSDYLLYLYNSLIYYIDLRDFENPDYSANPKETGIHSNTSFSVCGDVLLTHTNNTIEYRDIIADEPGVFKASEPNEKSISKSEVTNSSELLLSKNGNVYFSSNKSGLYGYDGNEFFTLDENVTNVRDIAEGDDGLVYYSAIGTSNGDGGGIFAINPNTKEHISIFDIKTDGTTTEDLGNIIDPNGICVTEKTVVRNEKTEIEKVIWIADGKINAVQEIDLDTKKFTEFAITTNSKAVNRLTEYARDITIDDDKIYALDENRIVVVNDIGTENRTYNRIDLERGDNKKIAVGNGYVLLAQTSSFDLIKLNEPKDDDPIIECENENEKIKNKDSLPNSINDVCYMDGKFYLLSSSSKDFDDGKQRPAVYVLDVTKEELSLEKLFVAKDVKGVAASEIVCDVFGTIYFAVPEYGKYKFYEHINGTTSLVFTIDDLTENAEMLNLQTDLDGNLYSLFDKNVIYKGEERYYLKTNDNLGDIKPAKSMCLSCYSERAYFIFEGLILRSSEQSDLAIATPYTIKIPDTFGVKYSQGISFGKIREGAKLFETEKKFDNEYFAFRQFAKENGEDEYVIKDLGNKYYFIIKEGKTAIARKTDLITDSVFGLTAVDGKKTYAAVDFDLYGIPVLNKPYALGEDVEKRSGVEITGEVRFNDKDYYVVKQGEKQGFIPVTFLREGFLSDGVYTTVDSGYVYAKGGALVYSDDLETKIDVIEKNNRVYLLSVKDGYAEILYDGKVGFVKDTAIVKTSRRNVVKASAVVLLAVSLFVTSVFFEKKYLFKD